MESTIKKIKVEDSSIHGHGVFAITSIANGETIERCTYLVIDDDDLKDANRLNDYLFNSPGAEGDYLLIMGHGMLYNHDDNPNAAGKLMMIIALSILCHARYQWQKEILHDYGSEYWDTRKDE